MYLTLPILQSEAQTSSQDFILSNFNPAVFIYIYPSYTVDAIINGTLPKILNIGLITPEMS